MDELVVFTSKISGSQNASLGVRQGAKPFGRQRAWPKSRKTKVNTGSNGSVQMSDTQVNVMFTSMKMFVIYQSVNITFQLLCPRYRFYKIPMLVCGSYFQSRNSQDIGTMNSIVRSYMTLNTIYHSKPMVEEKRYQYIRLT